MSIPARPARSSLVASRRTAGALTRGGRAGRAPTRVLLVCSGLDHARRGFESFARECFDALREDPGVHIELVKGSGPRGERERSIPSLRRDRMPARALARVLRVRPFRAEALAFALALQPLLLRRR